MAKPLLTRQKIDILDLRIWELLYYKETVEKVN